MKSVPHFQASFSSRVMAVFSQNWGIVLIHTQNVRPRNMPLWPKDYSKLAIFEKLQTQEEELWKQKKSLFCKGNLHLHFVKEIICKGVSLSTRKRRMTKLQETFTSGEGTY